MMVPWWCGEIEAINLTGKTLVFPNGVVMEPEAQPPKVTYIRSEELRDCIGVSVYTEHWGFLEEPPMPDIHQAFLVDINTARAYWDTRDVEGIYAVEGEEKEGKLFVTSLLSRW